VHVYVFLLAFFAAELETLQRSGFGRLYTTQGRGKSTVYFKQAPSTLREDDVAALTGAKTTVEEYTTHFNSVDHVDQALIALCRLQHPQSDLMMDIFD
jgi:hypothetical protein